MRRIVHLFIYIFMIMVFSIYTVTALFYDSNPQKFNGLNEQTESGKYALNTYVLETYNVVSYGFPHGKWMPSQNGMMTKDNDSSEYGEYQYLGFNYRDDPITNDRWFKNKDLLGKVFNEDYSNNVTWKRHNKLGIVLEWRDFASFNPQMHHYIMNTRFWDADHVTAGAEPTKYTLQTFADQVLRGDYREYAQLLVAPGENTTGVVRFDYIRDGESDYNTVEIPPLPQVKCIMTATPNIDKIPRGKTQDVIITIDTSQSYVLFKTLDDYKISDRYYWASVSQPSGSGAHSTQSSYQITVPNVSPNTVINVKALVFSQQVADLKIPGADPDDDATTTIFIGETAAPKVGPGAAYQHITPRTTTVVKADQRDNEQFDVSLGIPSGENLYANVLSDDYLYRLEVNLVSGSVDYSVTVNHPDAKGNPTFSSFSYSRSYSYYEITSLEVYAIKGATVSNGTLSGGKVSLNPSAAYKAPEIKINHSGLYSDHVSTGGTSITTSCSSSKPEDISSAASNAVSSPSSKNDTLSINGKTIMSEGSFNPDNLMPATISRDALYAKDLKIPDTTRNGSFSSSGIIVYERVYALNPKGTAEMTFPLTNINSVYVHTPVVINATVSSDDAHNQKPQPDESASALILGRPFTINLTNSGAHRNIKGYGTRDYTSYVKDREIRFGFDTYLGNNRTGKYLKANTWHSLEGLGIANNESTLTFYTPTWVDESKYNIDVRSVASNDTSNGNSTQTKANTEPTRYAAIVTNAAQVSGRVYDLTITDVDDISWELFFRTIKGKPDATGKKFFTGTNNINGDVDAARKYILPVMPGKNDLTGYSQRAVKLGYAIKFDLKTMGNYYDAYDFVRIMPTFYFVDKTGKNRQEVDLYYTTSTKPLVKIGSTEDTLTQSMKLNFLYRGITLSEFTKTAEALFKLRGGMKGYTLEKWKEAFPKISQNGVTVSKYFKILLSEPLRSFIGPDWEIPQGVDAIKAYASVQKWYGEYYLPADCLAVPKGTDLSKEKNLTRSSPIFLKDGYIIVNFQDIAVINNDDFDHPALLYTGKTADGWHLEGYNTAQGGWQLQTGDFVAYYADQRSSEDNTSSGTH